MINKYVFPDEQTELHSKMSKEVFRAKVTPDRKLTVHRKLKKARN